MTRWDAVLRLGRAAWATAARFPLVLFAAAAATVAAQLLVDAGDEEWLVRLLLAALLGLPLLVALTLFGERRRWPGPGRAAAGVLGLLVLAAFYVASNDWSERVLATRFAQLAVAFHLLVAILPYAGSGEHRGFWQYNRILFLRFLTAGLYSGVLFAGLSIALAAVDNLLGVPVQEEAYLRMWILLAFLFQTWFFLAGVPRDLEALEASSEYPTGLKVFAQYLLVPLVTTYLVILTVYLGKILWTREWPSGWIGYLVSSVAVLGILSLLLVHPVRDRQENRWVETYARGFWFAILPAVAMLLLAVWKRIQQYGVTENRYFLLVLGVWLAGVALFYALSRSRNIKLIPGTLTLLALVTFVGPWGAYSTAVRSQKARLAGLFERHGVLVDGRIRPVATELPFEDRREISAALSYLLEARGSSPLEGWFEVPVERIDTIGHAPGPSKRPAETARRVQALLEPIGLAYVDARSRAAGAPIFVLHSELGGDGTSAFRVDGPRYIVRLRTWPPDSVVLEGVRYELSHDSTTGVLTLGREGRELAHLGLREVAARGLAFRTENPNQAYLPLDVLRAEAEAGHVHLSAYLQYLRGRGEGDSLRILEARGLLLIGLPADSVAPPVPTDSLPPPKD